MKLERIHVEKVRGDQLRDLTKILRALPERTIVGERSLRVSINENDKKNIEIGASCPYQDGTGTGYGRDRTDWNAVKFNFPNSSRKRIEHNSNEISFRYKGFRFDLYKTR